MTWQPIETAPKVDGTSALLVIDGIVEHGWYERGRWLIGCEGLVVRSTPTHWMPWPDPPQP